MSNFELKKKLFLHTLLGSRVGAVSERIESVCGVFPKRYQGVGGAISKRAQFAGSTDLNKEKSVRPTQTYNDFGWR